MRGMHKITVALGLQLEENIGQWILEVRGEVNGK